jgi:hypothetical protein
VIEDRGRFDGVLWRRRISVNLLLSSVEVVAMTQSEMSLVQVELARLKRQNDPAQWLKEAREGLTELAKTTKRLTDAGLTASATDSNPAALHITVSFGGSRHDLAIYEIPYENTPGYVSGVGFRPASSLRDYAADTLRAELLPTEHEFIEHLKKLLKLRFNL